jgi:hypothetical protein
MVRAMKPKFAICILLTAATLIFVSGCMAQDKTDTNALKNYLPQGSNLPEGFKLIVALDNTSQGINMTNEINDFYGSKEIGKADAVIGKYWWGKPGVDPDAKVTIISLNNEDQAKAATSNYLENYKSSNTVVLPDKRSLINPETINGHEVTEITKITGESRLQFKYLWNNKNIAVLVDGNFNKSISMKFASATSL